MSDEPERLRWLQHVSPDLTRALGCGDVHLRGFPYDVSSPPRKIEVKAF